MYSESNWIKYHLPCTDCGSSDAVSIDKNGFSFCFSCGERKKVKMESVNKSEDYVVGVYPHRNISARSFEFFGVLCKFVNNEPKEICFPYPNGSFKIRELDKPKEFSFRTEGDYKNSSLFGMDKFDPSAYKTITITEGEYDAIACWDMLGKQTAAISVKSATSAHNDLKKDVVWNYVNSFEKIVLCFDNDEKGIQAQRKVASLFDYNKVFNVTLVRHKDANDYLIHNEAEEFIKAWQTAKRYTPDNIIHSFKEIEEALCDNNEDMIGTYPFKNLQESLFGLHRGEVIVVKGLEGLGKTEFLRAVEHHILKENKENKLCLIHLEENESTTIKGIATYEDKYPYIHPADKSDKKEVLKAYIRAVDNVENRVYIYESFETENETFFLDTIRYLATVCGVKFFFLDHITWLGTGLDNEDERKKLDRISQKLKLMAKEFGFALLMVSHVNDDGKTRGSRNITKVANTVIHLERDILNPSEDVRVVTNIFVEKARGGGNTGPMGSIKFDRETFTLVEMEKL